MDKRITLNTSEGFLRIIEESFQNGTSINLIIDMEGLERTEGFVHDIIKRESLVVIIMYNKKEIPLHWIVAVNGIFRSEYGEC